MDLQVEEPIGEVRVHWPTCPVCAAKTRSPYVSFDELEFVRCADCAVVYKSFESPKLRPNIFGEVGDIPARVLDGRRRFAQRVAQAKNEIRAAMEYGDPRTLLDVGCASGDVLEAGRQLGIASTGVDASEHAVKVCRERGYHAEVSNLESLPFQDAEFQLVVMKHVLEHTPSPKDALIEVRRVMSSKGLVIIAVPDLMYWKAGAFRPDDLEQQRYVYYSAENLRQLLETSGFDVLTETKATFRRRFARSAVTAAARELGRFTAELLASRRELFFVAQRSE